MQYARHLFTAYGVELEYMIVDSRTLNVAPLSHELLMPRGAYRRNELRRGHYRWSNELVSHVIELKTDGPVASLKKLAKGFQEQVRDANRQLEAFGARLLPTAMHPWMMPEKETVLWQYGDREIYEAFNRIFNCQGHGWSNLQSAHLNLPFNGDDEFRRLHSAIRLVLLLLPALAASSPFKEGRTAAVLDARLEAYRDNCAKIPSITGRIVPERVYSTTEYQQKVLDRIYQDLSALDPDGILRYEWVNARGAIARFDRSAIEIRVLDVQECPRADLAILQFVILILQHLVRETWSLLKAQEAPSLQDLAALLQSVVKTGEDCVLPGSWYARAFGFAGGAGATRRDNGVAPKTAGELLWMLFEGVATDKSLAATMADWQEPVRHILNHGCLSRRIKRAAGRNPSAGKLHEIYAQLAGCLAGGDLF